MEPIYDQIGDGYTKHRCADPRIVKELVRVLSLPHKSIMADIGAGCGNYSYALAEGGYTIEAVEPSDAMRRQASPHPSVRWHKGAAEAVPLPNDSVDAVVCVLAAHHFSSQSSAISEMERIRKGGPIVWLTFDPRQVPAPWLADYFPPIWEGAFSAFPPLSDICDLMGGITGGNVESHPFTIPWDLEDCFMAAGWRRPDMYLDPDVRKCMSAFALADAEVVTRGLAQLESDLQTGRWKSLYGSLLDENAIDWGYRIIRSA